MFRFPSAPCRAPRDCRKSSSRAGLTGRLLLVLAAGPFALGCGAKAKAATDPVPPLAIPAPPKHTLPEVEPAALRASSAAPEGALTEAPAVKPPPPLRGRTENESRPDPAANTAAPAATAIAPPEPPRELRSGAIDEQKVQGRIESLLKSATDALKLVETKDLSRNGKQTYSDAKGFIDTSRRMLMERRFDLALINAEKADKAAQSLRR
ncbi:MAG TPA: hypothetical protein VFV95_06830 [Vicinamibacterales bacterium]|nr:hypothetical protein [Vicinamibacterales bacterium]